MTFLLNYICMCMYIYMYVNGFRFLNSEIAKSYKTIFKKKIYTFAEIGANLLIMAGFFYRKKNIKMCARSQNQKFLEFWGL